MLIIRKFYLVSVQSWTYLFKLGLGPRVTFTFIKIRLISIATQHKIRLISIATQHISWVNFI